jgi:hypothetical protein
MFPLLDLVLPLPRALGCGPIHPYAKDRFRSFWLIYGLSRFTDSAVTGDARLVIAALLEENIVLFCQLRELPFEATGRRTTTLRQPKIWKRARREWKDNGRSGRQRD